MTTLMNRRRFISIAGAAVGLGLTGAGLETSRGASPAILHQWRGVALGADASLSLYHPDADEAKRLIDVSLAEVRRLEKIFSLYDENSALRRLNRDGVLDDPPQELVELLAACGRFSHATGGAFDATVQPLWEVYATHFSSPAADPDGPSASSVAQALARVDYRAVRAEPDSIRFERPGMSVTLNGVAQGYITDRVAELLRANGIGRTLVDMGEIRALDSHPAGRPWLVGLKDPNSENGVLQTLPLDNQAIGTSGGYGTQFDAAGRFNHIFNPETGGCAHRYLSVTVMAPTAAVADALSTAFSLTPLDRAQAILAELGATAAWFVHPDGRVEHRTA